MDPLSWVILLNYEKKISLVACYWYNVCLLLTDNQQQNPFYKDLSLKTTSSAFIL